LADVEIVTKMIDETSATADKVAGNLEKMRKTSDQVSTSGKKVKDSLDQTKSSMHGLNQGASGLIERMTGVSVGSLSAAGALTALGLGVKYSIEQAVEAEKIQKQLEAVITSTGGAAGLTADEVDQMAGRLSDLTAVEDDTIKKGAAVMLTFTKIGEDVFPQAMEAALNLSAAFGQDLQSSILQVGKALNDPSGMAAMKRVGVSFTEAQMEMGRELYETGRIAEYQRMVLQELNTEVGGAAAAAADTYAGQLQKLQNNIGNLAEEIGLVLLPPLTDATGALNLLITMNDRIGDALSDHETEVRKTAKTYDEYYKEMLRAAKASGQFGATIELTEDELASMGATVDFVAEEIGALTESQWEAARSDEHLIALMDQYRQKAEDAGTATGDFEAALDDLATIIGGQFGKEIDDYQGKLQDIVGENKDLVAKIAELEKKPYLTQAQKDQLADLKTKLGENRDALGELADAHEDAMKRMAFNMLMQRAESDGLTENELANLTKIGQAWGLYDEKTARVIDAINQNMDMLNTDDPNRLLSILEQILNLPESKTFNFEVNIKENGSFPVIDQPKTNRGAVGNEPLQEAWANGVDNFIVPPGYPNDSYRVGLTSGEVVDVRPPGKTGSRDGGIHFHGDIILQGVQDPEQFIDALMQTAGARAHQASYSGAYGMGG
jgi:hypothetical protein